MWLASSQATSAKFAQFLHLPSRELAFSGVCLWFLACLFDSCSLTAREMQIEKLLTRNYDRPAEMRDEYVSLIFPEARGLQSLPSNQRYLSEFAGTKITAARTR